MKWGKRLRRGYASRFRRRAAVKQTAATYSRHGKREQTSPPRRGFYQMVICGILFIALITLKLVMPGNLSGMRGTLGQWLVRDADFAEAFSAVGRAVSGESGIRESLSEAYLAVFGGEGDVQEVSGELIGADISGEEVSALLAQRELPTCAVAEQRVLGFSYTAPLSGTETSDFGWREHPLTGEEDFHYGIDIAADEGTDICCFADGTVGVVGESTELGRYLTVNHADGFSTLYAHCSAVTVPSGAQVKQGETIARVGQSGNATGAHLHFEVHDGEEYLNPVYYLVS